MHNDDDDDDWNDDHDDCHQEKNNGTRSCQDHFNLTGRDLFVNSGDDTQENTGVIGWGNRIEYGA